LAENRQISELFAKIGRLEVSSADTEVLVGDVCRALTIQAQLLQEIAYPALRAAGRSILNPGSGRGRSNRDSAVESKIFTTFRTLTCSSTPG